MGTVPYRRLYIWFSPHGSKLRGHEKHVGARLDEMREPLVESDAHAHSLGVSGRELAPEILIARLARAEHGPGGVESVELRSDGSHQVQALLVDHPGDHANHRPVERCGIDGELDIASAVRPCRDAFPTGRCSLYVSRQEGIVRRIPLLRVDAVENADEIGGAIPQDAVEPEPEVRRLDFFSVSPADRRDRSGVDDAAFEEADLSPELQSPEPTRGPTADPGAGASRAERAPGMRDCES